MSPPSEVMACYQAADLLAHEGFPYVFGGGHDTNRPFEPSGDIDSPATPPFGFDCSGWVSRILHAGGILEHPSGALGTHELARWGLPGRGEYMTIWVINARDIEHTVIEFSIPELHTWSAARHTGTICGWVSGFDSTGYSARRRK